MKMKYVAILALALWLVVTGWLASMVIAKPAVLRSNQGADDTAIMAELRNSIDRNTRMGEAIARLGASDSHFSAGPLVAVAAAPTSASEAAAEEAIPPPSVSLVLSSIHGRTAFVNGEQVRAGQRLSGGGRVRAIGENWVRIDDPVHGNQTYHVPGPAGATP